MKRFNGRLGGLSSLVTILIRYIRSFNSETSRSVLDAILKQWSRGFLGRHACLPWQRPSVLASNLWDQLCFSGSFAAGLGQHDQWDVNRVTRARSYKRYCVFPGSATVLVPPPSMRLISPRERLPCQLWSSREEQGFGKVKRERKREGRGRWRETFTVSKKYTFFFFFFLSH